MKVVLEIEVNNEGIRTYSDIVWALERKAKAIMAGSRFMDADGPKLGDGGPITDLQGNKVGKWEVTEQAAITEFERQQLDTLRAPCDCGSPLYGIVRVHHRNEG